MKEVDVEAKEIIEAIQYVTSLVVVKGREIERFRKRVFGKVLQEIVRLCRKIRHYDYQEKRLARLFRYDDIAEDYVLDEMNQLKKDRQAEEEQLARLCETKKQLTKLANAEIKLNEFCARLCENLTQCTTQDKRLALDALDIKVTATPERIDIKSIVPIEFITIEQTWA